VKSIHAAEFETCAEWGLVAKFWGVLGQTMKKRDVLEQVAEAHQNLIRSFNGLTETEAACVGLNPSWSIKDALSHIVAWEQEGIRVIREVQDGGTGPGRRERGEIDEFNARAVQERRARPLIEILDELKLTHDRMVDLIGILPDEIDESSIIYKYIYGVTIRHMTHHASQIVEYRKAGGETTSVAV